MSARPVRVSLNENGSVMKQWGRRGRRHLQSVAVVQRSRLNRHHFRGRLAQRILEKKIVLMRNCLYRLLESTYLVWLYQIERLLILDWVTCLQVLRGGELGVHLRAWKMNMII